MVQMNASTASWIPKLIMVFLSNLYLEHILCWSKCVSYENYIGAAFTASTVGLYLFPFEVDILVAFSDGRFIASRRDVVTVKKKKVQDAFCSKRKNISYYSVLLSAIVTNLGGGIEPSLKI